MRATKLDILRASIRHVVAMLTDKKIPVYQRGTEARCDFNPDGTIKCVIIPNLPDSASDELIMAIQGFLDHEVAHCLFTDFKWLKAAGQSDCHQLFNILEDTMIESRMRSLYKGSAKNLANVWGFVQGELVAPQVEKAIATGSDKTIWGTLLVVACRAWAGQEVAQEYMDDNDLWDYMNPFEKMVGLDLIERIPKCESSEDTYKLAAAIQNRIEEFKKRQEEEARKKRESDEEKAGRSCEDSSDSAEDPDADEDAHGEGEAPDGSGSDPEEDEGDEAPGGGDDEDEDEAPSDEDDREEDTGAGSEEEEDEEEEAASEDEDEEESAPAESEEEDEEEDEESDGDKTKGSLTIPDEMDPKDIEDAMEQAKDLDTLMEEVIDSKVMAEYSPGDYWTVTTDFDVVEKYEPENRGPGALALSRAEDRVRSATGLLSKRLERLIAARSFDRKAPGYRSGAIHTAALHRIITSNDDRVFRRKIRTTTKDVAVQLVVDCSGSMSGDKIQLAMDAAWSLSAALERIKITNEVIGFTTTDLMHASLGYRSHHKHTKERIEAWKAAEESARKLTRDKGIRIGRFDPLYLPVFKDFAERFTNERKMAMALAPEQMMLMQNVDGESIMHCARRLTARSETRKIMIVLSDGHPAASGDSTILRSHLKHSVKILEDTGTEVFGIGIKDRSVEQFYRHHVVLDDMTALPTTVMQALERMLLSSGR